MGCVTLLSDFGLKDASVAIAKGILMQHIGSLPIDISHDISPYQTQQAAYLLASSYGHFPAGSVHIILSDLFSEKNPKLVLSAFGGHYFLSPDNGVLPLALGVNPDNTWLCHGLKQPPSFTDWLHETGRIAALLQRNTEILSQLPQYTLKSAPPHLLPTIQSNLIKCDVVHIDHYGNVVINVTRNMFDEIGQGRRFRLQFMKMEEITDLSQHYTDVREGYKLCRFNSSGYLEICINRSNAASLFGLRAGGKNNNIKLYFE